MSTPTDTARSDLIERVRKEFVVWWALSGRDPAWLTQRPNGTYKEPIGQAAWEAFQFAASRPIEVTDEMVETAANSICHYSAPRDINSCCPQPMGEKWCQVAARKGLSAALSELAGDLRRGR